MRILGDVRAWLIGVVAAAGGCVSDREEVPRESAPLDLPSAGTAKLKAGTIVLADEAMEGVVVLRDHLIFPIDAPVDFAKGDVIVSGSGDGFIRRVVMVEAVGDVLRVFTTSATLGDAVESATFHATLFESVAFDEGMQGQTDWLTVQMHGAVSLAPTLDLRFAVSGGELAGFELGVTGTAAAQLGGAVQFTSSEHWTWGDEKRVSSMLFRRAFAIGPIPIVVVGRMTTVLGAQAYVEDPVEMYAGASAALTLDARSQFTPGLGWVTSDATTYAVTQDAGTQSGEGHASLAVGVFPRFELAFFGNQEAELGISAQTGALATYCNPAFVTGQQAQLQGAAHFRLASLANPSETTLTLFDRGFSLDPIEQCTP